MILVFIPLSLKTNAINAFEDHNDQTIFDVKEPISENLKQEVKEDNGINVNNSFDIESLFHYLEELFDVDDNIFLESIDGYPTSIATYEALSTLRFLGLDYYLFGDDWQKNEDDIATKLLVDFQDEAETGGYVLTPDLDYPSLDGTFGVVTSLWLMNEIPGGAKLKSKAITLLDFTINETFFKETTAFHETNEEPSIKATFQALTILDLIQKIATNPDYEYDETIAKPVNETVYAFMANYSVDIFNYIDSFWENNNSYFHSQTQFQTPITDTWYALQSISILERFEALLGISLPREIGYYQNSVSTWVLSLQKETGTTKGGFGLTETATVTETGMCYAILNLFNTVDKINHTKTLPFIYSSQFLEFENRTYTRIEQQQFGGFGPNNSTYTDTNQNKLVNIHSTYYAILTLLLSGNILNSVEIFLKTDQFQIHESINRTNLIIQGERATIELAFKIYNYSSHGSLDLLTTIDNWNLNHIDYLETNPLFLGKSIAEYEVKLQDDTEANFNWTLGTHQISNQISIRNLPVIQSPTYIVNSTVFVAYAPIVIVNQTEIHPGDNIFITIFFQNRSSSTFELKNITLGSVSMTLTSPNNESRPILEYESINISSGAIEILLNFSKYDLLGEWNLQLYYNQSNFELEANVPIFVSDSVFLYDLSSDPQYFPGENMNLNVSLKYTNGFFTTKANASLVFISNATNLEVFSVPLSYLTGNSYTTSGNICPNRFLFGYYNISVLLVWNTTYAFEKQSIYNETLPRISISGIPTIADANFKTDYRNSSLIVNPDDNTIYYGETINLSLSIGFISEARINNITNDSIVFIEGGLVNNTATTSYIQQFDIIQKNETVYASALINSNLPAITFGTRFQIRNEWNNSFVYLRDTTNISKQIGYNFSLQGTFEITNVSYIATEYSGGLYKTALDSTSVLSITFKVKNSDYQGITVPNLNLYALLDIEGNIGALNKSLPRITLGNDENGIPFYLLTIPISNLDPDTYFVSIFTRTAITDNSKIGILKPSFMIVRTFSPKPLIQLHEALILITGVSFMVLLYLNLKKSR